MRVTEDGGIGGILRNGEGHRRIGTPEKASLSRLGTSFDFGPTENRRPSAHDAARVWWSTWEKGSHPERSEIRFSDRAQSNPLDSTLIGQRGSPFGSTRVLTSLAQGGAQDSTGTIRKGRVVPAWSIVRLQADGEASALRSRCGYGRCSGFDWHHQKGQGCPGLVHRSTTSRRRSVGSPLTMRLWSVGNQEKEDRILSGARSASKIEWSRRMRHGLGATREKGSAAAGRYAPLLEVRLPPTVLMRIRTSSHPTDENRPDEGSQQGGGKY